MSVLFAGQREMIRRTSPIRATGRVGDVIGPTVIAEGLKVAVGSLCSIERSCEAPIPAQVIGLRNDRTILMALHEPRGVRVSDAITSSVSLQSVHVGRQMLGAVLDGMGRPIGGRTDYIIESQYPVYAPPPPALSREPIDRCLPTGIRAIDAFCTVGQGQRIGVFAGTGLGKSVLLGMIARLTDADVIVVALIGERGREVGDLLRKDLGPEGLARTVMVVSTSDESPVLRVRAAFVATAVAEYFRDLGTNVLLLTDSITRMATAQRQIGLAAGEPPTTRGYPPSVFSLMPGLLERCGRTRRGSITGVYTVLVEGDDIQEPVSDSIRGTLDGHLWLSRSLAERAHYPAVSVLESISRVMPDVVDEEHVAAANVVRRALARYADVEDLVHVGAYVPGADPEVDAAVKLKPAIDEFLRQGMKERSDTESTRRCLLELASLYDRLKTGATQQQKTGQSAGSKPATSPA